jgi:HemY protein
MDRVIFFLTVIAALALGGAWIADRPGEVAINWLGWRIETSVLVAMAAVAAMMALTIMVWSLLRLVVRSPRAFSNALHSRRRRKGYQAISRGLVAVGSGDGRAARKFASEAERLTGGEPLALLLRAQTAQLSGDRAAAEQAFRTMTQHDETRLLGLRGLYVEAWRRDDRASARGFAEAAVKSAPALQWAGEAVLEFRCTERDWQGALAALEANNRSRLVDREQYRRLRAVLLTARAQSLEATEPDAAKALALEAAKLAPGLVPAASLAGRLAIEAGERRRAAQILERAWRINPHPDLAEIYAHLRTGDTARDRLARVQQLARHHANHREGALAIARAAIAAQEFGVARKALGPLQEQPTQRVAMLMASLEEAEHDDEGRAREWMARAVRAARDPAWTADGFVSDRWMPVSPVSGRLDAFEWKVPLAELAHEGAVDSTVLGDSADARAPLLDAPSSSAPAREAAESLAQAMPPGEPTEPSPSSIDQRPTTQSAPVPETKAAASSPRPSEAVIPLIHAPDDPGPEAGPIAAEPAEPQRRFPSLFR